MIDSTTQLLNITAKILDKYKAVDKATGQNFNVFSILGLEYAEVKTHTAFLAELLNPNGSHGQDDLFLSLFLRKVGIRDFDCKNATVETEKYAGNIDVSYESGGQIDLFISDNASPPNVIIIENKILAGDQHNQLKRYFKFGQSITNKDKISLFYLTPFGTDPSTESKANLYVNKDFRLLSYQSDILPWLQECFKEIANIEILRVNLIQYINIIKKMTGQAQNTKMTEELVGLFSNKDFYSGFFELEVAMKHLKIAAQKNFWEMTMEQLIEKDLEIKYSYKDIENNKEYLLNRINNYYLGTRDYYNYGLHLYLGELKENIKIYFKVGIYYSIYFGIQAINSNNEIITSENIRNNHSNFFHKLSSSLNKNKNWGSEKYFILSANPKNNFNFSNFKSDIYFNFNNKTPEKFRSFLAELDHDILVAKKWSTKIQ